MKTLFVKTMNTLRKAGTILLVAVSLFSGIQAFAPASASAANWTLDLGTPPILVVCGNPNNTSTNHPCTFSDLIVLANNIIKALIWLAVPLALVGISYAGWLYLTAGGGEGNIKKAKEIFSGLMWGFIWLLVAYAFVYTIVSPILSSQFSLFKLGS